MFIDHRQNSVSLTPGIIQVWDLCSIDTRETTLFGWKSGLVREKRHKMCANHVDLVDL